MLHQPQVLIELSGMFHGYNSWAVAVVVNNALNGLAISAILKYADNIARVYAHACAMLLTMVLSVLLFSQSPTPQLVIACSVVGASTIQYNTKSQHATPQGQMQDTKKNSVEDMEDLKQMVESGDGTGSALHYGQGPAAVDVRSQSGHWLR